MRKMGRGTELAGPENARQTKKEQKPKSMVENDEPNHSLENAGPGK